MSDSWDLLSYMHGPSCIPGLDGSDVIDGSQGQGKLGHSLYEREAKDKQRSMDPEVRTLCITFIIHRYTRCTYVYVHECPITIITHIANNLQISNKHPASSTCCILALSKSIFTQGYQNGVQNAKVTVYRSLGTKRFYL